MIMEMLLLNDENHADVALCRCAFSKQIITERKAKLQAITKIQAVYRGQVDRKKVKAMKQQQEEAATKIQAIRRGKEARKEADSERQAKLKAITKIHKRSSL